jgi:hypothetical protein
MWRIGPLLGRDLEANNGTTAVSVQLRRKHASTRIDLLLGKHVGGNDYACNGGNGVLSTRSALRSNKK